MKNLWISYSVTILLLGVCLGIIVWFFAPSYIANRLLLVSPLPDFLLRIKNDQVSTTNVFLPSIQPADALENTLRIDAKSSLSYDLTTQQVLQRKNPRLKLPMASLTKIMTAIVGLENAQDGVLYTATKENIVGENSMGITPGEKFTLEELLHGLVLLSGNDAAEVIASNYKGGREKFIVAMNTKAKALGLTDTNFTNPSGLSGDGDQYTTAYDLLVITNYALTNFPMFADVAKTVNYHIPRTENHKEFYLSNETNLLTSYPGVKGVKDGYTKEAGLCLVTYLDYNGHKIIAVLLGSDNRRQDMKDILDFSLKKLGVIPPKHN
ncbi:MAG: D-alanyl-D-alanine carboxypeptidase [Candidatus Levybacteria bacterium]|nr:D-alanyl-D-alanine carboxypeptidase [Candidatus Levybacteria bacterium]